MRVGSRRPWPARPAAIPPRWPRSAAGGSVTGRFTRPEEVADLVLLLASDRAGNTTGADVIIDGGLTTSL